MLDTKNTSSMLRARNAFIRSVVSFYKGLEAKYSSEVILYKGNIISLLSYLPFLS